MDTRVVKREDGTYCWVYRLDMKENKSMLYLLGKILVIILSVPLLLFVVIAIAENSTDLLRQILPIYLLVSIAVVIIGYVSYLIVGRYFNGAFTYYYEMDEEGVSFSYYGEDEEKTKKIGELSMLTGMMTRSPALVGSGVNMAYNQTSKSIFSKVRSIKAIPERDLIKVNSLFLFNQIYVNKEDYQFVLEFIESHTGLKG